MYCFIGNNFDTFNIFFDNFKNMMIIDCNSYLFDVVCPIYEK